MVTKLAACALAFQLTACTSSAPAVPTAASSAAAEPTPTVAPASELKWEQLNPARGDQSPKAATLWGDRKASGPSGFLVRFVDGFSSPPHIHNVSYRGVVIDGLIHNDDPNAEAMWMPTGSFWTQPKGAAHITAAKGSDTMAYIEIEEGPYLVRSVDEAFRVAESPLRINASSIVWRHVSGLSRSSQSGVRNPDGPMVAFLWGDAQNSGPRGLLVKLRVGSTYVMQTGGSTFHAVVIQGEPSHHPTAGSHRTIMGPGSYIDSKGAPIRVACESPEACIFYVRTKDPISIVPGAKATQPAQVHRGG